MNSQAGTEERSARNPLRRSKISQRKRAAEALKESEERFRALSENAIAGIFIIQEGRLAYVNQALAQMFGYEREDLLGADPLSFIYREDRARVLKSVRRRYADASYRLPAEYRAPHKNGEMLRLEVLAGRAEFGGRPAIIGNIIDVTKRRKAEEALLEERNRARHLLDIAGVMIVALDPEGIVTLINKRGCEILGCRSDEIVGTKWIDTFVPARVRKHVEAAFGSLMSGDTGAFERIENPVLNRQGEERIMAWRNSVIQDASGKVVGTLSSGEDVTERRGIAEALRLEKDNFHDCLEMFPIGVQITDRDGKFIYANPAMLGIWGFDTVDELKATPLERRYTPESLAIIREMVERSGRGDMVSQHELVGIRKGGEKRDILVNRKPMVWNGETCVQILYQDITERKHAEEALRESERKYRDLMDSAPVGIVVTSLDGHVLEVNKTLVQMHGYASKREFMKSAVAERFHDVKDRGRWVALAQKTGKVEGYEVQTKRKDGSLFWTSLTTIPRTTETREQQLITISQDITERKKAEANLRNSKEQLAAVSAHMTSAVEEERTRIAREIHDELGQSLTALQIDLFWLRKRLRKSERALIARSERMTGLIDQTIRSVQRLSSSLRPGILDDLGLFPAIEWLCQDFRERTGMRSRLSLPDESPAFDPAVASQLFRIIQEAMTNVSRHSGATELRITGRVDNGVFSVEIRDNGRGIEEKEINSPRSFGLLGMKERVRQIGGDITIEGTRGIGTVLTVRVPFAGRREDDQSPRV